MTIGTIVFIIIIIILILIILGILFYAFSQYTLLKKVLDMLLNFTGLCTKDISEDDYTSRTQNIEYPNQTALNATNYNVDLIKFLLQLSMLVAIDKDIEATNLNIVKYEKYVFNGINIIHSIIDSNNYMWLLFRGTTDLSEVGQEFQLDQVNYHGLLCHHGFTNLVQIDGADTKILADIQSNNITKVFAMGHSMGAANLSIFTQQLIPSGVNFYCVCVATPPTCNYGILDTEIPNNSYFLEIYNKVDNVPQIIPALLNINNVSYTYSHRSLPLLLNTQDKNNMERKELYFDFKCPQANHVLPTYYDALGY